MISYSIAWWIESSQRVLTWLEIDIKSSWDVQLKYSSWVEMFNSSTWVESECKYENSTWWSVYIKCSNESEMQAIHDLDVKFINRLSSYSVRLWNQICDLHAKLKHRWNIQSSLIHQTSAYAENEKNVELHNRMNTQLSKKSRDIANIQWINKWHT